MLGKKYLLTAISVLALLSAVVYWYFSGSCKQQSVLSGTVVQEDLVRPGDKVAPGDVLVKVDSVAGGSIAAARADRYGTVAKVLVKPGDKIAAQQAVAELTE